MKAASRAGGGLRQAWRRENERDHDRVATSDQQRAVAFSQQLRQAHQDLRSGLTRIGEELGRTDHVQTGLQAHCVAFCSSLTAHHVGEDEGMFTALMGVRPDLAPAIRNLISDHAAIAALLVRVQVLAKQAAAPSADLAELRRELDGLAAIAESHFRYEERAISAALDHGVPDTGWSPSVFRPVGRQDPLP
jgi:hypothetical protein